MVFGNRGDPSDVSISHELQYPPKNTDPNCDSSQAVLSLRFFVILACFEHGGNDLTFVGIVSAGLQFPDMALVVKLHGYESHVSETND